MNGEDGMRPAGGCIHASGRNCPVADTQMKLSLHETWTLVSEKPGIISMTHMQQIYYQCWVLCGYTCSMLGDSRGGLYIQMVRHYLHERGTRCVEHRHVIPVVDYRLQWDMRLLCNDRHAKYFLTIRGKKPHKAQGQTYSMRRACCSV